jgi:hypothetical protein
LGKHYYIFKQHECNRCVFTGFDPNDGTGTDGSAANSAGGSAGGGVAAAGDLDGGWETGLGGFTYPYPDYGKEKNITS